MCTLASSALRALLFGSNPHAHNITARRCIFPSKRHFLVTPRRSNPDDPAKGAESALDHVNEEATTSEDTIDTAQGPEGDIDNADGSQAPSRPRDLSGYGSAARRAGRHIKKPKELPPFFLPPWFFERNVFLREELSKLAISSEVLELGAHPLARSSLSIATDPGTANATPRRIEKDIQECDSFHKIGSPVRSYDINVNILHEISSLVRIGLGSALTKSPETWMSSKADLLFYHPKFGGTFFLDELVTRLAATHRADLIRLDPQDIADIGGSYIDDRWDTHFKSLSTLGYDVYPPALTRASLEDAQDAEEALEEDDASEGEEEDDERSHHNPSPFGSARINITPISQIGENLMDTVHSAIAANPNLFNGQKPPSLINLYAQPVNVTSSLKISSFLENTLNASEKKREISRTVEKYKSSGMDSKRTIQDVILDVINDPKELTEMKPMTENLIVMVKDYVEIQSISTGAKLLAQLHEIVKSRRKDGQNILVIGTSSSEDFGQEFSRANVNKIQSEPRTGPVRTILTPYNALRSQDLIEDHHLNVALINLRNIQDMLRRLSSHSRAVDRLSVQDVIFQISSDSRVTEFSRMETMETMETVLQRELGCEETFHKLKRHIWPLDLVHHVAAVALGLKNSLETSGEDSHFSMRYVIDAIRLLSRSQAAKYKWMEDGQEEGQERMKSTNRPFAGWSTSDSESRMKKLRKICNGHEKKLLSGVIDPKSIRTTFADVRAPPETIGTLKNLTSLSLVRPEAFTYGVLATDKIPGLLLYGPPGTGKSLLARATAKESGATVLEVSGADVYDMYVGEGEKNVKAIFSLAKKLSPCIVFIDEADAILGARGGPSDRTTHREMINQFLREWDGMGELSAFIMVATNRPFDLDEASLRRLPRRVLVDLPTEEDREAILKIHLKDESLDPEVSLAKLASNTPFYSGSDLKNLAVAAALSCVREEVENAASPSTNPLPSTTDESTPSPSSDAETATTPASRHVNPERRILAPRHFTHALEEISASISDDMGSLAAIRKFDDKFGDRRGRRKKVGGYGFETVKEGERKLSDRARVRIKN